jgi:cytochrome P450
LSSDPRAAECDVGPYCFAQTPIFLDRPHHTRFRRLLEADLALDAVPPGLEPAIQRRAEELLAPGRRTAPVEFMASVAAVLSAEVLATFFGGDPSAWSDLTLRHPAIWGKPEGNDDAVDMLGAFQRHIWQAMMERKRSPTGDAMSRMIQHSVAGGGLRLGEIHTLVLQMAVVANESIIRMLGSVAKAVAEDAPARHDLSVDRRAIHSLLARVLRACPPIRGLYRRSAVPVSVSGLDLPADHGVFVDLKLAGHHDAQRGVINGNSDSTPGRSHLAFGAGIHRCPGARLAMMAGSALGGALSGLSRLEICEGGLREVPSGLLEGPSELWLELGA